MRKDNFLNALTNFFVPIIFLLSVFFLTDFFKNGFFSIVYAIIIAGCGYMIITLQNHSLKNFFKKTHELWSYFLALCAILYCLMILMTITDFLSI